MSAEYYETALDLSANASDIRLAIKAMVVDNTPYGWTHVEDWTESSTTWTVLKCPAASSGLPEDFHVVIAHPQTAGSALSFFVCEGYDTTNHRMKRPQLNANSTFTPTAGAGGSMGDDNTLYRPTTGTTSAARTAGTGLTSGSAPLLWSFSSTAIVAIAFYADGMNVSLKGANNYTIYAGAFRTYVKEPSTNDPMPVGIFGLSGIGTLASGTAEYGATRSAMNAGVSARHHLSLQLLSFALVGSNTSNVINSDTWDKYAAAVAPYFAPFTVTRAGNQTDLPSATSAGTAGFLRGWLPYVVTNGQAGALTWGDTIDIDTDRFMYAGANSSGFRIYIYIGPVPA